MKIILLLFWAVLVSLCTMQANAQLRTFQNFSHRDGLHMSSILSVGQSSDGFIWIGTDGSDLINFDGDKFTEIGFPTALSDHHFKNVCFSGNEVLFASQYKGFYSYNRSTKQVKELLKGRKEIGMSLYALKKGSYTYLISEAQIAYQYNGRESILAQRKKQPYRITQVLEIPTGFLVFDEKHIFLLENGKLTLLEKWLKTPLNNPSDFKFGFYSSNTLTLITATADRWLEINLSSNGKPFTLKEYDEPNLLHDGEQIVSLNANAISKKKALITSRAEIYEIEGRSLNRVSRNYPDEITGQTQIIVDMNGDFWVSSKLQGLFKVSIEPFTKLRLHPIYEEGDILLPYKTNDQKVIISRYNGKTYVGSIFDPEAFKEFNFTTYSVTVDANEVYYLATSEGIKIYDARKPFALTPFLFENQRITSVYYHQGQLWIGRFEKGLASLDLNSKELTQYKETIEIASSPYTIQPSFDDKSIYIGTNDGLYSIRLKTRKVERLTQNEDQGAYIGNSCKDSYGNTWFTMEKGLHVILKNGSHHPVFVKEIPSNMLYTLSSDDYANIIIGTNKGLSILNVN